MDEQLPKFTEYPDPNVVLRGGPLNGGRIRIDDLAPVALPAEDGLAFYHPSGEMDSEDPTLHVYVPDDPRPPEPPADPAARPRTT